MRYDILKQVDTITSDTDNVPIEVFDVLNVDYSSFQNTNGFIDYVVTAQNTVRPWYISSAFMGDFLFEDLIFLVNGVENPLDLFKGKVLRIPSRVDLITFANQVQQTQ